MMLICMSSAPEERSDPAHQRSQVARLDVDAALSLEVADQALARGDEAHHAAASRADVEGELPLVSNQVSVVDEVAPVDVDRFDAAVAGEPEVAVPADLEEERALFREQPAEAPELQPHVDVARAAQVRARGEHQLLAVH